MSSKVAADGATARRNTDRPPRSIIALYVGPSAVFGNGCFADWRNAADRLRRRWLIAHILRRTARHRGERGEQTQAIGRSRGGRNTKIHAVADVKGRLLSILLTGGEAHDCPLAEVVIRGARPAKKLLGDKAYDSAPLRHWLDERGTKAVIPSKCNRKQPFTFNKKAYRLCHRVENAFCRLKDFRRIATRYDRLARNFMASVCLIAAIVWWI